MKNKQGLTIAALIVAIVGLSIGFAAFSNTLQISSSASVNPDASALKVVFAKNYFSDQVTTINQLITTAVVPTTAGTGVTATNGVINNDGQDGPTLTGLSAAFTQPGQSVTYDLYVVNAGQLKAYLTDIVFGTTGNPAKKVSCTVAQTKKVNDTTVNLTDEEKATQSLVDAACEGISVSVKIKNLTPMTASGSLNNLPLEVKGYEPVQIVISYATGSAYVDGPMNVAFGDISINASSVAAQASAQSNPWITRGLTSSNVQYGQSYVLETPVENLPSPPSPVILYSNGDLLQGMFLTSDEVNTYFANELVKAGTNWYIMVNPSDDTYVLVEFDSTTTATIYASSSSVATYEDVDAEDVKNGKFMQYSYVISQGE